MRIEPIDHVNKFGLEKGFAFTMKRSDNTLTHPRVKLGFNFGGSFRKRKSVLVEDKNHRERGTHLTDCRWKAVKIQRNEGWHLVV